MNTLHISLYCWWCNLQQHWSADWELTLTPTWHKLDLTSINWLRYLTFHIEPLSSWIDKWNIAVIWFSSLFSNIWLFLWCILYLFAFSVLMLLVGRQEGHLACKNWVVRYRHGYLSGVRCKWFTYGQVDCHAIISCSSKIQNGLPFWCWLTRLSWKKGHQTDVLVAAAAAAAVCSCSVNSQTFHSSTPVWSWSYLEQTYSHPFNSLVSRTAWRQYFEQLG